MSNWDILGGNDDGNDNEEEVEYVGVIEEDVPAVQEPTRAPRKNVRRVAPRRMPTDQTFYPVAQNKRHQNGVVGSPNRDQEDLVSYVNMPHGKQLGLTPEAVDRLQTTPMTELNGQMSQRIEPGTYVMYGPSRADKMGMGTNGDPWSTEGLPGFQTADAASSAAYESQTSGGTGWLGDLFGAVEERLLNKNSFPWLNKDIIKESLKDHKLGKQNYSNFIMTLLVLDSWQEEYV